MTGDQQINREPLVSIIIPVYNVRKYICEALDSVINQTYKNLEIIVSDDGSTDGSGRVCDVYAKKDPRIRVIHQENKGLSAARNAGLDVMTGEYVGFLDSDDAFEPEMVECMVRGMLEHSAKIAVCGWTAHKTTGRMTKHSVVKEESGKYYRQRIITTKEVLNMWLFDDISNACWNKLYKKSLWNDIRFPEGHVYEDMMVSPNLLSIADRILLVNRQLVRYRRRSGSITRVRTADFYRDYFLAMQHTKKYVAANTPQIFSRETRNRLMDTYLRRLMVECAEVMVQKNAGDREKIRDIPTYLLKLGKKMNGGKSARTRIVCILFRIYPQAIPVMRMLYFKMKPAVIRISKYSSQKQS